MLKRHSLEAYLLDDGVLEALVSARGSSVDDALGQLKAARDEALLPDGSAQGALGAVFDAAKHVLGNTEAIGENASQFSADVLARLITLEMKVRKELLDAMDLLGTTSPGPAAEGSSGERPVA